MFETDNIGILHIQPSSILQVIKYFIIRIGTKLCISRIFSDNYLKALSNHAFNSKYMQKYIISTENVFKVSFRTIDTEMSQIGIAT